MKILIDRNIERNAIAFGTAIERRTVQWGDTTIVADLPARKRNEPRDDECFRRENIPYIATVARLARDNKIQLFQSPELMMERMRHRADKGGFAGLNLLEGIGLKTVTTPVDRLVVITSRGQNIGTTEDEQNEFFRTIKHPRYKEFCKALNGAHIDDAFHVWTAEAENLDCFLTMDTKFLRPWRQVERKLNSKVKVLTPKELCELFGEGPADLDALSQENHPFR